MESHGAVPGRSHTNHRDVWHRVGNILQRLPRDLEKHRLGAKPAESAKQGERRSQAHRHQGHATSKSLVDPAGLPANELAYGFQASQCFSGNYSNGFQNQSKITLTKTKIVFEQLSSMDDHHQEVIAYCRENNFNGIIANDSVYAIFDPPSYFSSEHLKLTYKVTTSNAK